MSPILLTLCILVQALYTSASAEKDTKFFYPAPGGSGIGFCPLGCFVVYSPLCPAHCRPGLNPAPPAAGTAPGTGTAPADVATQRTAAVNNGNAFRARHRAAALAADAQLNTDAQQYAEQLARTCATTPMAHSTPNPPGSYGENLARLPGRATIAAANDAWYNTEVGKFCPSQQTVRAENAHFTQMVWKSTTKVGYGSATGCGYTFVVARYTPAGNYVDPAMSAANVQC